MHDEMTTVGGFPVIDITHKPKRVQGENFSRRDNTPTTFNEGNSSVPTVITIERAITYFENNAKGEFYNLYSQTAKWLREFMSKSVPIGEDTSE